MEVTQDEVIKKYGTLCKPCNRKCLKPYEYERTCFGCGYNKIERKNELSKNSRNKIIFINRQIYAEHKIFCICIEVYKTYEDSDCDKKVEPLPELKNKKLKIDNILIG